VIEEKTPVCEEVAVQMAQGARKTFDTEKKIGKHIYS